MRQSRDPLPHVRARRRAINENNMNMRTAILRDEFGADEYHVWVSMNDECAPDGYSFIIASGRTTADAAAEAIVELQATMDRLQRDAQP